MPEENAEISDRLLYRYMRELDEHVSSLRAMSKSLQEQIEEDNRFGGRLRLSDPTQDLVQAALIGIGQDLKARRDELNRLFGQLKQIDEINYPDPKARRDADRERSRLYQVRDKQRPEIEDIMEQLRQRIRERKNPQPPGS